MARSLYPIGAAVSSYVVMEVTLAHWIGTHPTMALLAIIAMAIVAVWSLTQEVD